MIVWGGCGEHVKLLHTDFHLALFQHIYLLLIDSVLVFLQEAVTLVLHLGTKRPHRVIFFDQRVNRFLEANFSKHQRFHGTRKHESPRSVLGKGACMKVLVVSRMRCQFVKGQTQSCTESFSPSIFRTKPACSLKKKTDKKYTAQRKERIPVDSFMARHFVRTNIKQRLLTDHFL